MRICRRCIAFIQFAILASVAVPMLIYAQPVSLRTDGAMMTVDPTPNGSAPKVSPNTAKSVPSATEQLLAFQATQNADYNFASLLRLHRLAALELAKEELAHGKDPVLRAVAGKLVASHKKEIEPLDQWLDQFRRFD